MNNNLVFNYHQYFDFSFTFRHSTAMDISGVLLIDHLNRFQYKVSLFKLSDDSYLFDNFEELFDSSATPLLNQTISEGHWILNEVQWWSFICRAHK